MDLNSVLAVVEKMFPSANLNGAVEKAQAAISGTKNSLDSVSVTAKNLGITSQAVNEIYRKYGGTMQGRALCGVLGTTPEALKADAEKILGGGQTPFQGAKNVGQGKTKFPRLK